tara:strand:- start:11686 stop:11979 length:294 start_codon:yes stop_codon:yes gene_type:complete
MNNIEINSIEDVGFSNPSSRPQWSGTNGEEEYEKPYFGQLDPNWREKAQELLDEQQQIMREVEDSQRKKSLPKEIMIFGGGIVIVLTILIIYKYKKK